MSQNSYRRLQPKNYSTQQSVPQMDVSSSSDRPTWARLKYILNTCSEEKSDSEHWIPGSSILDRQAGNVLWGGWYDSLNTDPLLLFLEGPSLTDFVWWFPDARFLTGRCDAFSSIVKNRCDELDAINPMTEGEEGYHSRMTQRAIEALVTSARGHNFPIISYNAPTVDTTLPRISKAIGDWYERKSAAATSSMSVHTAILPRND